MSGLLLNFKRGGDRTSDQKHRLGVCEPDDQNRLWSYVQFREDVAIGEGVVDVGGVLALSSGSNTSTAGIATVTTVSPVGSKELVVADAFGGDNDKYLVGAIGYIHAGGAAASTFFVEDIKDDDTIVVEFLTNTTGYAAPGEGLEEATTTDTKFTLYAPGLVAKRNASLDNLTRGIAQAPAKAGEYGWVLQKGWGVIKIDVSGAALTYGRGLIGTASSGLYVGYAGTVTVLNTERTVGQVVFTDLEGTGDRLLWANLRIDNTTISYSFPDVEHAFNKVTI